jgi:hypothetical protein
VSRCRRRSRSARSRALRLFERAAPDDAFAHGEILAFYRRAGFDVVSHGAFPDGGCRDWTLVRPAPVTSA